MKIEMACQLCLKFFTIGLHKIDREIVMLVDTRGVHMPLKCGKSLQKCKSFEVINFFFWFISIFHAYFDIWHGCACCNLSMVEF
jgi:hypothetical protein